MHHLGVGYAHARKRVLAIADDTTVTVIELYDRRNPLHPHHRPHQELLAQHNKEPRADGRALL